MMLFKDMMRKVYVSSLKKKSKAIRTSEEEKILYTKTIEPIQICNSE